MSNRQYTIPDEIIASNGKRFANVVIDYVARLGLTFVIGMIAAMIGVLTGNEEILIFFQNITRIQELTIGLVVLLVYYNIFEIFFGTTVGKLMTKTVVVDEYGEKPVANAILIRSLCRLIPFEFFSFFGTPCVGWHDSLSKTYVVNKEELRISKELFHSFEEIGENQEA
ncbi:RDD family protein [Flavobacterium sp.]|uniref:RDD family protein n=1 Tax=Flavobacterium sp. TaxID=239 RepID=UPI0025EC9ED8|nr:RDD family protein [Flavobacterium sp.]